MTLDIMQEGIPEYDKTDNVEQGNKISRVWGWSDARPVLPKSNPSIAWSAAARVLPAGRSCSVCKVQLVSLDEHEDFLALCVCFCLQKR
jgi:hypothetical protein